MSFRRTGRVDVAVIVVSFNSENEIVPLLRSLRGESRDAALRVIVVDNDSTDGTLDVLRGVADVIGVRSGGNLGYAGAINIGLTLVGDTDQILILNPDSVLVPGCINALRRPFHTNSQIGVTAPRLVGDDGQTVVSLFHEPSVWRALCDAALGRLWRSRPSQFSEWDRRPSSYQVTHPVDSACGAALMISHKAAAAVGDWDEQFFLYSEETDFLRRVRDVGLRVQFEPDAVVRHSQGRSGRSFALDALVSVNRIRYVRKHQPRAAGCYRLVVILNLGLRSLWSRSARNAVLVVCDERRWGSLPSKSGRTDPR